MQKRFSIFNLVLAIGLTSQILCSAWALGIEPELDRIEMQLFNRPYQNEPVTTRLDRIEDMVYGPRNIQPNPDPNVRFSSLQSYFKPNPPLASLIPSNLPPVTHKPSNKKADSVPSKAIATIKPNPTESDYPIVTEMERRVLGKTAESESLENRLAALEQKTLGHPQQGDLQQRTDQLRMMVLGDPAGQSNAGNPNDPQAQDTPQALADVQNALPSIEQRVLSATYPNDSVYNRLNRLEAKVFQQTAPELSAQDRLVRISTVIAAQKSGAQDDLAAQQQQQLYYGNANRGYGGSFGINSRNLGGGAASAITSILFNMLINQIQRP